MATTCSFERARPPRWNASAGRLVHALLVALCLLPGLAAAQGVGQADEAPWGAVFSREGLPDFSPILSTIEKNQHTAIIPLPDADHELALVWGDNARDSTSYWLMHRPPRGSVSLRSAAFTKGERGVLEAEVELVLNPSSRQTTTLCLRLLPAYGAVLYRWPGGGGPDPGESPSADVFGIRKGKPLPELEVELLEGGTLRLGSLRGRVVVINSWGTWCPPCLVEIPGFNGLMEKFADYPVTFVAIAKDSADVLRAFLENTEFRFQQALADEASVALLGSAYPRTVVLDREGVVDTDLRGGSEEIAEHLDRAIRFSLAKQP